MVILLRGKYVFVAAPERRECDTISMGLKLSPTLLRICTAALNFVRIPAEVIVELFPFLSMKVLTCLFVCGLVRLYDQTRVTIFPTVGLHRNNGDLICTCRKIHFSHRFIGIEE